MGVVAGVLVSLSLAWNGKALEARGGWNDPVGGFAYSYEANEGEAAFAAGGDALSCLDGNWRRSSSTDQWDGSSPDPVSTRPDGSPGAPGGVAVELLPGEGENGLDATALDIEDVGDPRSEGFADPSNRRVLLWRDTTSDLNLALGVTLVARWRRNPAPRAAEFATNGGPLPVPNGSSLADQNKGQLGFVQKTPALPGTVAAGLGFAITDGGQVQFAQAFNGGSCTGATDELCFNVADSGWVTVWMTAKEDLLAQGVHVKLFFDGSALPAMDKLLTDIRADSEGALLPESGRAARSYIYVGLPSTAEAGAVRIDYLCILSGAVDPTSDCNGNGISDSIDLRDGTSLDCNSNGKPDECDAAKVDCNATGIPDDCDISSGSSQDCNSNRIPDECDAAQLDCNGNSQPDDCDISSGVSLDCNANGAPDSCDLTAGGSPDCNRNDVPDECDLASGEASDCNSNGAPDPCDITNGTSLDCNRSGIPDECEVASGARPDCNLNGSPDECDLAAGVSADINANGLPDECEPAFIRGDANCDSKTDISDSVWSLQYLFGGGPRPCCADAADVNDDGKVDISDPIRELNYLFQGAPPPPSPGPAPPCGVDPTNDDNDERLGPCQYPRERCPLAPGSG